MAEPHWPRSNSRKRRAKLFGSCRRPGFTDLRRGGAVSGVRGRPFKPGNKFGKGRPRGSRNKVSAKVKEILLNRSEALTQRCVLFALRGNTKAMQMCLDRIAPVQRDHRVDIGSLPMATAADLAKASEIVTQKAARGL